MSGEANLNMCIYCGKAHKFSSERAQMMGCPDCKEALDAEERDMEYAAERALFGEHV